MERRRAFIEYASILKEAEEWLDAGYRGSAREMPVRPPAGREPKDPPVRGVGGGTQATASPTFGRVTGRIDAPAAVSPAFPRAAGRVDSPGVPGASGEADYPAAPDGSGGDLPISPGFSAFSRGEGGEGGGAELRPGSPDAAELSRIASEIRDCRKCNLHLTRENTVPGFGPADCLLMVITPAPGDSAAEGDSPLPPFEDEYLGKWLTALELRPGRDVFITPAVKCRTPGGRPPAPGESAACAGYLHRQYRAAAPRAVLALGASACGSLTGSPADFPALVGRDWNWGGVPALVLWTPAEVLANPARLRSPVWESLKRLKAAWNALS